MPKSLRMFVICCAAASAGLTHVKLGWFLAFGLCIAALVIEAIAEDV